MRQLIWNNPVVSLSWFVSFYLTGTEIETEFLIAKHRELVDVFAFIISFFSFLLERFSIECRQTKTKPITYQLDCSTNLKVIAWLTITSIRHWSENRSKQLFKIVD